MTIREELDKIRTTFLDDRDSTHFEGCKFAHPRCAIARLLELAEGLLCGEGNTGGERRDAVPVVIRPYQAKDFRGVEKAIQVLSPGECRIQMQDNYELCLKETYVAVAGEEIVGVASCQLEPKITRGGGWVAHIEDVSVLSEWQGKGIGRLLVEHILKVVIDDHCRKVILNCSEENVGFYQKLGFRRHDVGMRLDLE